MIRLATLPSAGGRRRSRDGDVAVASRAAYRVDSPDVSRPPSPEPVEVPGAPPAGTPAPTGHGAAGLSGSTPISLVASRLSVRTAATLLQPSLFTAYLSILSLCSAQFLGVFISAALSVAIPTIGRRLDLGPDQVQWPSAVLSLATGATLLPSGGVADAFGRRATFLVGLLLYAIALLVTGFVKSGTGFIAMSACQGVAIALVQPASVGILSSGLPDGQLKNSAFALFGAAAPMGFAIGLVIGGLLAERFEAIYWLCAGASALSIVLAAFVLPKEGESLLPSVSRPAALGRNAAGLASDASGRPMLNARTREPAAPVPQESAWSKLVAFDWLGVLLSSSGLVLVTFALADAETKPRGFATPYIPALLPLSALLLTGFTIWERRLERAQLLAGSGAPETRPLGALMSRPRAPLVPFSIWGAKGFTAMLATVFFAWLNFNSIPLWITLAFQEIQKASPVKTAIYFLLAVPLGVVANMAAGMLVGRIHVLWLISLGCLGGAASALAYAVTDVRDGFAKSMLAVELLMPFPDIFLSPAQLFACTTVGPRNAALAGSLFNLTVRLASSLGLAITSAISTSTARTNAARSGRALDNPDVLLLGYQAAAWACFTSSMLGLVVALIWLRGVGIVGGRVAVAQQVQKDDSEALDALDERAVRFQLQTPTSPPSPLPPVTHNVEIELRDVKRAGGPSDEPPEAFLATLPAVGSSKDAGFLQDAKA